MKVKNFEERHQERLGLVMHNIPTSPTFALSRLFRDNGALKEISGLKDYLFSVLLWWNSNSAYLAATLAPGIHAPHLS